MGTNKTLETMEQMNQKHHTSKELDIYKNKRILITGQTGFKGSWLTVWLLELGAEIIGISNEDGNKEGIFQQAKLNKKITALHADIRNLSQLKPIFTQYQPDIVFHLAAQALVLKSYDEPLATFETNILGTANILECIRNTLSVKAAVIITSDKCYKNKEWLHGYRETDELGGSDPYSASKSCAEIITQSYVASFLQGKVNIATTRAGNVIGGGDWSKDRIVPDIIKALQKNSPIPIRNPNAIRPWQHVLEPLYGYMLLGSRLYTNPSYNGAWNFGPPTQSIVTVQEIVEKMSSIWGSGSWENKSSIQSPPETKILNLDSTKSQLLLNWTPKLDLTTSLQLVVDWYKQYQQIDAYTLCQKQIADYMSLNQEIKNQNNSNQCNKEEEND